MVESLHGIQEIAIDLNEDGKVIASGLIESPVRELSNNW